MPEPAAELTDRDVARILGLKSVGKLTMLLTEEAMYMRGSGGVWYRLSDKVVADG